MSKRVLSYVAVALLSVTLTTLFQPLSHLQTWAQSQQSRCQTFAQTGKTVCGRFLEYWQRNGGVPQQGYPISDTFTEVSDLDGKPYTVQYFERAVFELHPENPPPHDVLLSQLGTFRYREKYPQGAPTPGVTGKGAISGTLGYPSEQVPPLSIYAIEVVGSKYYSVTTTQRQQTFTIQGLDPGAYYVVAYWDADPDRAGAYSQFVLCGLRATCTDHSLIPVVVKAGETTRGVRVEDWYAPVGTFPARPDGPARLLYMWPKQIPQGFVIAKQASSATESAFVLELVQPGGGQFWARITGGRTSAAANPSGIGRGETITVRGRPAILFTTGAGFSVYWQENGYPYAVIGGLPRNMALSLAESLEPLDLATWRARLQQIR